VDFDPAIVAQYTVPFLPRAFIRVTRLRFRDTPLGMGPGDTRFSSPSAAFRLLYLGKDLATSIAETIVRDRFEGAAVRELMMSEITAWGATSVSSSAPLRLLDVRGKGCLALGVSTDIKGAKGQDEARRFSEAVYSTTSVDGILYLSRLTGEDCIAVYDRAAVNLHGSDVVDLARLADTVPALLSLNIALIR
jgi:hypothetical protein